MNNRVLLLIFLLLPLQMLAQNVQDPFEEALFRKLQMSKNQIAPYQLTEQEQIQLRQIDRSLITRVHVQPYGNTAAISQFGSFNDVMLLQQGTSLHAIIEQLNHSNAAHVEQKGSGNFSLHQSGNENYFLGNILGLQTQATFAQQGNGNYLNSHLKGNGLKHEIHQYGEANYLEQMGFQSVPLIIHQRGVGMNVRISGH